MSGDRRDVVVDVDAAKGTASPAPAAVPATAAPCEKALLEDFAGDSAARPTPSERDDADAVGAETAAVSVPPSSLSPAPREDAPCESPWEAMTPVQRFLVANDLEQYVAPFTARGYDDVEDVVELVFGDPALFKQIVALPGHRAKITRLLKTPSLDGSPSPFRRAASSRAELASTLGETQEESSAAAPTAPSDAAADHLHHDHGHDHGAGEDAAAAAPRPGGRGGGAGGLRVSPTSPIGEHFTRPRRPSLYAVRQQQHLAAGGEHSPSPPRAPPRAASSESLAPPTFNSLRDNASLQSLGTPLTPRSARALPPPIPLKVVVVGQGGVGKSSFIARLVKNTFATQTRSTLGIEFSEKKFRVGSRACVSMQLWDVYGQETLGQITRTYYANAKGALVFYDVTDRSSLLAAVRWKQDIDTKVRFGAAKLPLPVLLVGNKADAAPHAFFWGPDVGAPAVRQEVQDFCNEHRFAGHFFTSAKTGEGIRDVAEFLVHAILKMDPMTTDPRTEGVVTLDPHGTRRQQQQQQQQQQQGQRNGAGRRSNSNSGESSPTASGSGRKRDGGFFTKC